MIRNNLALVLVASTAAFSGCGTLGIGGSKKASAGKNETQNLVAAQQMPSAEGTAKFKPTSNDNTSIDLTVKHLAHPERLTPPATTYVVWLQHANGAPPQNIGALKVDDQLTGTLDTVTPQHSFDLFITAENNSQIDKPSGQKLLWTSYKS